MKMSLDSANKTVKLLKAEQSRILEEEHNNNTYSYFLGEEIYAPDYDFASTQEKLSRISDAIIKIKVAVRKYNTEHILKDNMTVDEAILRLAFLSKEKEKYDNMRKIAPKTRVNGSYRSSSVSEYRVANFSIEEVQARYVKVYEEVVTLQDSINAFNLLNIIDVDVDITGLCN